jgi:hypothetical protein
MPGRKFTQPNNSYRYGFNGQEKSDDVTVGNTTAMYWEYDSRIGRRWNVDPKPVVSSPTLVTSQFRERPSLLPRLVLVVTINEELPITHSPRHGLRPADAV